MTAARAIPVTTTLLRGWPLPGMADIAGKEQRGRVLVIGAAARFRAPRC